MRSKEELELLADEFMFSDEDDHKIYHLKIKECVKFAYGKCKEDYEVEIDRLKKIMIELSHEAMSLAEEKVRNINKKFTEIDVINIVDKSRETGLTAEYLILQLLNKQD